MPAARQPTPGCVPRGTDLPLVLGEQLGAAEEVLIPGERDDGLWELPQVELQQGGHCVHVCGAGMKRETRVRRRPRSCKTNTQAPPDMPWTVLGEGRGLCVWLGPSGTCFSCPWSRSGPGCPQAQEVGPPWGVWMTHQKLRLRLAHQPHTAGSEPS